MKSCGVVRNVIFRHSLRKIIAVLTEERAISLILKTKKCFFSLLVAQQTSGDTKERRFKQIATAPEYRLYYPKRMLFI